MLSIFTRFFCLLAGLMGCIGVVAISSPASSATMKAVYKGTITSGYDATNELGVGTNILDGSDFIATFIYNPLLAGVRFETYSDIFVTYQQAYGGTFYGYVSPVLSAKIEVGGGSRTITPEGMGVVSAIHEYPSTASTSSHNGSNFLTSRG